MTDNFLSGWGDSEGKINKYVVSCKTYEQAQQIERNAKKRSEMKRINIVSNKPYYNKRTHLTTFKTYEDLGGMWKD